MNIQEINAGADKGLASLIRYSFKKHKLDIPGTVYFDQELDCLSKYYLEKPECRRYFVLWNNDEVCGGIGFAEFEGFENCAEIQKFYLADNVKGIGWGRKLFSLAEKEAVKSGYRRLYIETHTNFELALQMYLRHGYRQIDKPLSVSHCAMNSFLIKDL